MKELQSTQQAASPPFVVIFKFRTEVKSEDAMAMVGSMCVVMRNLIVKATHVSISRVGAISIARELLRFLIDSKWQNHTTDRAQPGLTKKRKIFGYRGFSRRASESQTQRDIADVCALGRPSIDVSGSDVNKLSTETLSRSHCNLKS